jgi:hypothetical protein
MAAPPITASPASWNPAVPPPPVTGAAVGIGLNEGIGDRLGVGVGLMLDDSDGLGDPLVLSLAVAGTLGDVPALTVPLALGLTEPLAEGESRETEEEGFEVPPPDVQAASATQASRVLRPQPMAVSLARCAVPAMAVRAFIEPPRALGNDHFPVASRRNRRGKERTPPGENADDHNGKPRLGCKPAMARPSSEN